MKGFGFIERTIGNLTLGALVAVAVSSCCNESLYSELLGDNTCSINFNVSVAGQVSTRSQYSITDQPTTLDANTAFGVIGVAAANNLLIDNEEIVEYGGNRRADLPVMPEETTTLNAYYPYSASIDYHPETRSYIIMYKADDITKGAKVSNSATIENTGAPISIDLEFRNITNQIGFRIAEITEVPQLEGHVRVRKVTAYGIASEGFYNAPVDGGAGSWSDQNNRKSFVMFEGDSKVPVGESEYLAGNTLSDSESDCTTFFEIPEAIRPGLQYVRVIYDIEPFESECCICTGIENLSQVMMLDGVLPDNEFIEGKKYIFDIGLDMKQVFKKIEFSASTGCWENTVTSGSETAGSFTYKH